MKLVTYTGPADETLTSDEFAIQVEDTVYEFKRGAASGAVPEAVAQACEDYEGFNFEVKSAPKGAERQEPAGPSSPEPSLEPGAGS